jgi:membrane protein required for colicin V production
MNYLDIAISVPILYGLIKGISNGLIKEITGLLSLILGVYIAVNFSVFLERHLIDVFNNYEQVKPILAFSILFIATIIIVKFIGILANKITKVLALGVISRIFGGIFGGLKIALIVSFLLTIESKLELIPNNIKKTSELYSPNIKLLEILTPHFEKHKKVFKNIQQQTKEAKELLLEEKIKKE